MTDEGAAPAGSDQARSVELGEARRLTPEESERLLGETRPDLDARERNIRPVRKAMGPTGQGRGLLGGEESPPPSDAVSPTDPAEE